MTAVGFEPTPFRTGAWSQRLRPLGQTVSATLLGLPGQETPSRHAACHREERACQGQQLVVFRTCKANPGSAKMHPLDADSAAVAPVELKA